MPQFEVKVSDLISPRVAVILVMKNNFFRNDFTQTWKKLSNCHQCYQTPKMSQGTNRKKIGKKSFCGRFCEKRKIDQNYPALLPNNFVGPTLYFLSVYQIPTYFWHKSEFLFSGKLASIFLSRKKVVEDPAVVAARKAFLLSSAPLQLRW